MNETRLIYRRSSPLKRVSRSLNLLVIARLCCNIFTENKFGFSALTPPTAIRSVQTRSYSLPYHSRFLQRKFILSEPGYHLCRAVENSLESFYSHSSVFRSVTGCGLRRLAGERAKYHRRTEAA